LIRAALGVSDIPRGTERVGRRKVYAAHTDGWRLIYCPYLPDRNAFINPFDDAQAAAA
jgi:hypothetical protein